MFRINMKDEKDALKHALNISTKLVFVDGLICSLHDQMYAFTAIESPGVKIGEPVLSSCEGLPDMLKSKEAESISFYPEENRMQIERPYTFEEEMPTVDDDSKIGEVEKRWNILSQIDEELKDTQETIFVDKAGEEHDVFSFQISNSLMLDMLQRMKKEDIEIMVSSEGLKIQSMIRKGRKATYNQIKSKKPVSVMILEDSYTSMTSAFLAKFEEKEQEVIASGNSTIIIVDKCYMVIENRAKTIINSKVSM